MPRSGDEVVVVWPRYFDQKRSRAEGRRVPVEMAVKDPDVAWLEKAAKKAGLKVTAEPEARDPFRTWKSPGRLIIDGKGNKEAILRQIASNLNA